MSNPTTNRVTSPPSARGHPSPRTISIASRAGSANLRSAVSGEVQISKVTGKSLQSSLHEGFIELVDALDMVGATLSAKLPSPEDPTTLKYKTKHLLQTKGTQAVYWMQLIREICLFTENDLTKKAAAARAQVKVLTAHGETEAPARGANNPPPPVDATLPNFYATIRLLFDSVRDGILEMGGLRKAIENFVVARDAAWEAQIAKLHVHYGRLIDKLRFDFYKEVEEADMKSSGAAGPALQLGGFDVNEVLDKLGQGGEEALNDMPVADRVEQKEKYLATSDLLKIIIPPKLATIAFPSFPQEPTALFEPQPTNTGNWCWDHSGGVKAAPGIQRIERREDLTYRFHLALPQSELAIPSHVIDRYAREVLYKNHEIISADELAQLRKGSDDQQPVVSLQVTPAAGDFPRNELGTAQLDDDTGNEAEDENTTVEDPTSAELAADNEGGRNKKDSPSGKRESKEAGALADKDKEKDKDKDRGTSLSDKKKSPKKSSSTRPTSRTLLAPSASTKPGSRRTPSVPASTKSKRLAPKTTSARLTPK